MADTPEEIFAKVGNFLRENTETPKIATRENVKRQIKHEVLAALTDEIPEQDFQDFLTAGENDDGEITERVAEIITMENPEARRTAVVSLLNDLVLNLREFGYLPLKAEILKSMFLKIVKRVEKNYLAKKIFD